MVAIGAYGILYAAFSPKLLVSSAAIYASIVFFLYFTVSTILFFIRNNEKTSKIFSSKFKYYFYICLGIPFLYGALSWFHYGALSKGLPSLLAPLVSDRIETEVVITDKRLWGKRNRNEEVYLSGYKHGFPVSRPYYNSVAVGDKINVVIMGSLFGDKIQF